VEQKNFGVQIRKEQLLLEDISVSSFFVNSIHQQKKSCITPSYAERIARVSQTWRNMTPPLLFSGPSKLSMLSPNPEGIVLNQ
jgi:hypothetical protein